MFGLISKKKLLEEIKYVKDHNRKEDLYANYEQPVSEIQKIGNIYSQGYEDGTDNLYNFIVHKFNLN